MCHRACQLSLGRSEGIPQPHLLKLSKMPRCTARVYQLLQPSSRKIPFHYLLTEIASLFCLMHKLGVAIVHPFTRKHRPRVLHKTVSTHYHHQLMKGQAQSVHSIRPK